MSSDETPTMPVRVAVADDDPLALTVIEQMIRTDASLEFAGSASSIADAIALASDTQPDVMVLDWNMPAGGGAQAARHIHDLSPDIRLLGFTSSESPHAKLDMMRAGAKGVVHKGCSLEQFVGAIHSVLKY